MYHVKTGLNFTKNLWTKKLARIIQFLGLALLLGLLFPVSSYAVLVGAGPFDRLIQNAKIVVKARVTQIEKSSFESVAFRAKTIAVLKGDAAAIPNQLALEAPDPIWPKNLGVPFVEKQVVLLILQTRNGKLVIVNHMGAILPATDSKIHHPNHSTVARKVFDELRAFLPQAKDELAKGLVLVHMSQLASKEDEDLFVPYAESTDEWLRRATLASLLRIKPTSERVRAAVGDFRNHLSNPAKDPLFWEMYKDVQWVARCGAWGMEKNMTARARAYLPIYRTLIDKAPPGYQRIYVAIEALKNVGTREDIGRLYRHIDDEKAWMRHDVAEGLGRILGMKTKRPSITTLAKRLFRYRNPIRSDVIGPIRDPQIINVGDTYYLTGTTGPFWPGTICPGIKLWSSKDLLNWKFETFLIERSKLPEDAWYRDRFWASEIHQKNGKFWLTFNCRNESEKYPHKHSCGLAVADKITGPYTVLTKDKPLLEGWGNDMTLFTDDDGKTYAYWKSHFVQEIDLENAKLVGERQRTLRANKQGWEKSHIEGMFIIKRNGVYYMFYSSWTRGYEVGYATAKHPMGPWTKYEGNPIYGAQDAERCKEMGVEYTGDPNSPYYGVGHCTIFTGPDGRDWICAHHHMKGCGHKDSDIHLGFDPIWIEDGVIKTNGPTYTPQVIDIPVPRR